MPPSWSKYNKLLKTIEKGKIKKTPKNLKIHENWRQTAYKNFEKSENPKIKSAWGKKFSTLRKTWRACFTALKYNPAALDVWELYGDASYELARPDIAIDIYEKLLELHPEHKDQIRTKISHATKLHSLFDAMETGKLPVNIEYKLLKCLNCGTSENLLPYMDTKTYMTQGYPVRYRVTSTIAVPLCKSCYSSAKYNARRNLKYDESGASIKVKGSSMGITFTYWKRHVLLEKYKAGLLDDAMFSALRVKEIIPKEGTITEGKRTKLLSTYEGKLEWIRIQHYDLKKTIQEIADDLGSSMIRVEKYLKEIEKSKGSQPLNQPYSGSTGSNEMSNDMSSDIPSQSSSAQSTSAVVLCSNCGTARENESEMYCGECGSKF